MNFSTDQRPLASTSRLNVPAVVTFSCAPTVAVKLIVRTTSRLISAKISVERMLANSCSASKPWTAFKSCASSIVYSAFKARLLAVTAIFSMENAISWNWLPAPSPNASACAVVIPVPRVYSVPADKSAGEEPVCVTAFVPLTEENAVLASLNNASVPPCVEKRLRIAKIKPVGPVIG